MITMSACHAGGPDSVSNKGSHGICGVLQPGSQHWGLCMPCESKNHIDISPASV